MEHFTKAIPDVRLKAYLYITLHRAYLSGLFLYTHTHVFGFPDFHKALEDETIL